jgi:hypothetical protein
VVAAGADATLELPDAWTADPPVLSDNPGGATVMLPITSATLRTVDYTAFLDASLPIPAGHEEHQWTLHVGSGWTGNQPSVEVSTPDLDGVAGWTPGMAFPAQADVAWSITRIEHDAALDAAPTPGRRILSATVSGHITR